MKIETFATIEPTDENYFRSVVMIGRNVASYKFALAKALVMCARAGRDAVPLSELAVPFASEICAHLRVAPKQATSASSSFLDACRRFNEAALSEDELHAITVRSGFNNVIDAFHRVGAGDTPVRFFRDERRSAVPAVALTESMREFAMVSGLTALDEAEARWRLVETAWELGTAPYLIAFDQNTGTLVAPVRRRSLTSARPALNAYQRGRCFYCYCDIGNDLGEDAGADVDHVFPHVLERRTLLSHTDGLWNLVLACRACNRGPKGKFDATPATQYIERLHRRNEYLILSHHPLRETLMRQTGSTGATRHDFLQRALNIARIAQPVPWSAGAQGPATF